MNPFLTTLIGLALICIGILDVASPETGWRLKYGWRFKDTEPSENTLKYMRIIGVFIILVGAAAIVATLFA